VNISEDLSIQADPTRLKQILINLLGNSVKFTDVGEVDVTVCKKGKFAKFTVRDTGCGIPEEKFKAVFSIFEQVDNSSTRVAGGTGLGLPITQRLIHLHGGKIELESKLGKGSTFTFTMPLERIH
jgi:signal transduction histidine kinase